MADPRDIVARLRQLALVAEHEIDRSAFEEAADEIERLRADLLRCRDAIVQRRLGPSLRRSGWMNREILLMTHLADVLTKEPTCPPK